MATRRFTAEELDQLDLVVFHLQMLEYGLNLSHNPELEAMGLVSPIPRFFSMFGVTHLMTTMFLVDKKSRPMGGFCYFALSRLNLAGVLEPIRKTLECKVGNTTLGDFLRLSRNKLMVHGDLSFGSLPLDAQAVPRNDNAVAQFNRLMARLGRQVARLQKVLLGRLERGRALLEKKRDARSERPPAVPHIHRTPKGSEENTTLGYCASPSVVGEPPRSRQGTRGNQP